LSGKKMPLRAMARVALGSAVADVIPRGAAVSGLEELTNDTGPSVLPVL